MNLGRYNKQRNGNIELLRIILMIMVVILHLVDKGNLIQNLSFGISVNATIALILKTLSICAVNTFILVSGYFLIQSEFKFVRLFELIFQVLFISIVSFVICAIFPIPTQIGFDLYSLINVFLPFHMNVYWFLSIYIVLYMLLPIISMGVKNISKRTFQIILICLLFYGTIIKSFVPFRLAIDGNGYDFVWFLTIFLVGTYIRLYGLKFFSTFNKSILLYFVSCFLIFAENIAVDLIYIKTNHLGNIRTIAFEYNNIFVFCAGVGLFLSFLYKKDLPLKFSNVVCCISPYVLGVYILHENMLFRYNWQKWLNVYEIVGLPTHIFILRIVLAITIVFCCGVAIDFIRKRLFCVLCAILKHK